MSLIPRTLYAAAYDHCGTAYDTGARVVLTTMHLNHIPEDCREENLLAACNGCHLHYDAPHHALTAYRTRFAEATRDMEPLFDLGDPR